eukprot:12526806-Alexandrium_andersonii.AAC.1
MAHTTAMCLVVSNETVARAVIAACRGGLLDAFAARVRLTARLLDPRLQRELVDMCSHFKDTPNAAAAKVEQYWQVVNEKGAGCIDGEMGSKA